MAHDQSKPVNVPAQRLPKLDTAAPRPSLANVPAQPDYVIRSMTRDAAASVIASRHPR